MTSGEIYSDGTYLAQNPTLHQEDSDYKMRYVDELLRAVDWPAKAIRILDIGGGAGVVGRLVCEWFRQRGHAVECEAIDLSAEMLAEQRRNNPYLKETWLGGIELLTGRHFDLVLLLDVIEHVPEHHHFARQLNALTDYIVYNIPTERNLMDYLRNLYMRGRYYPLQTASLGHIHFFSAPAARGFVRRHHRLLAARFPAFAEHILRTDHPSYLVQRQHRLRAGELRVSALLYRWLPWLAPWLVQGSMFMLAQTAKR